MGSNETTKFSKSNIYRVKDKIKGMSHRLWLKLLGGYGGKLDHVTIKPKSYSVQV